VDGAIAQSTLMQGLRIVGVGIGGVFVNLLLLMLLIKGIGLVFGKKPAKKSAPQQPEPDKTEKKS
jgi:Na+-transporting methylmalonyl-CoA/oxaloacetate decarboxylase gamma subunit